MEMCRACLQTGHGLQTLFVNDYVEQFKNCTSLDVTMHDGLPSCLCENCFDILLKFHHFKQICIQSDSIMRKNLNIQMKTEDLFEVQDIKLEVETTMQEFDDDFDTSSINQIDLDEIKNICMAPKRQLRPRITKPKKEELIPLIKKSKTRIAKPPKFKNPKQLSCNVCKKKFHKVYNMEACQMSHDERGKDGIPCGVCNKKFKNIKSIDSHMQVHLKKNIYQCSICERQFYTKQSLDVHMCSHDTVKRYVCHICGHKSRYQQTMKIHLLNHTGEKPVECNLCHKKFRQHGELHIHTLRHKGIKEFHCQKCPKKFYTKYRLKMHQAVHSDKKSYPCGMCDKSFKTRSFVKVHHRTHTGERPFQCDFCPDSFYSRKDLKNHRMRHTGEKPYKCTLCDKRFIQKCALNQHSKYHKAQEEKKRASLGDTYKNDASDENVCMTEIKSPQ